MGNLHLTNVAEIKRSIPDFDHSIEFEYTPRELILLAEKILLTDERPCTADPMWLNAAMYKMRVRREIQTANGTPDPAIVSGMYWRTHPDGRPWNTDQRAKDGGRSFYAN
jgi:hypothetical protein